MSPNELKTLLRPFRQATETFELNAVRSALAAGFSDDATYRMCHPFGELTGSHALLDSC